MQQVQAGNSSIGLLVARRQAENGNMKRFQELLSSCLLRVYQSTSEIQAVELPYLTLEWVTSEQPIICRAGHEEAGGFIECLVDLAKPEYRDNCWGYLRSRHQRDQVPDIEVRRWCHEGHHFWAYTSRGFSLGQQSCPRKQAGGESEGCRWYGAVVYAEGHEPPRDHSVQEAGHSGAASDRPSEATDWPPCCE